LRAIGEAVEQDDDVRGRRAVFVKPWPRIPLERCIGGIVRNDRTNRSNRIVEGERRRRSWKRVQISGLGAICERTCPDRRSDGAYESPPIHVSATT
jgi:hypothetical protein